MARERARAQERGRARRRSRRGHERALRYAHWNKTKAAEILGIRRPTIYEKIKQYDLKPAE
ncbi:helix-turn-helix domain-containing protein [bacterium]|nr:helix-turn-helix domain-containing protein [bacterium]